LLLTPEPGLFQRPELEARKSGWSIKAASTRVFFANSGAEANEGRK